MAETSNCEMCNNFVYDDEDECYVCDMDLDEDDMVRFLWEIRRPVLTISPNDEYLIVRHQM